MMKVVIDTNVLVSGVIKPAGVAGRLVQYLRVGRFTLIYSPATLEEVVRVLSRPHIQRKYGITDDDARTVAQMLILRGVEVFPAERITACRDGKDNIFLEAAVAGKADALVSGDADLLVLHPFRGIPILTIRQFLENLT